MPCHATPINEFRINKGVEMKGYANCLHALVPNAVESIVIPYHSVYVAASYNNGGDTALEMKTYHINGFKSGNNVPRTYYGTVEGGWHSNYIKAFAAVYGYYVIETMSDSGRALGGYTFPVRAEAAIYSSAGTVKGFVKAGGAIMTDGTSTAGESYGDRLYIKAWRDEFGQWKDGKDGMDLWVPTGLREGKDTMDTLNVYSTKW